MTLTVVLFPYIILRYSPVQIKQKMEESHLLYSKDIS